jgi:hypothetical protein
MSRLGRDRIPTTESGLIMKDSRATRSKAISTLRTGLSRPRDEAVEGLVAIGMEPVGMRRVASSHLMALVGSRA